MNASSSLRAAVAAALLGIAACSKLDSGPNEMSWARAALERNDRIEVVASDVQASTFTVRVKDTGELRVVKLDQVVAGPPSLGAAVATTPQASSAASTAANAPAAASANAEPAPTAASNGFPAPADSGPTALAGETAAPPPAASAETRVASADAADGSKPPRSESASGAAPGRVLASGPGYTIKASADSKGATLRRAAASGPSAAAALERMHEPIICQGQRFLQIDNRNLEFDGDAVSAEDGCEIHITNSRILAKGVGVQARRANVHIENSDIEGESGSIAASGGAQVYSASSTFKGLRRREDTAAFHDLGGNAWN